MYFTSHVLHIICTSHHMYFTSCLQQIRYICYISLNFMNKGICISISLGQLLAKIGYFNEVPNFILCFISLPLKPNN